MRRRLQMSGVERLAATVAFLAILSMLVLLLYDAHLRTGSSTDGRRNPLLSFLTRDAALPPETQDPNDVDDTESAPVVWPLPGVYTDSIPPLMDPYPIDHTPPPEIPPSDWPPLPEYSRAERSLFRVHAENVIDSLWEPFFVAAGLSSQEEEAIRAVLIDAYIQSQFISTAVHQQGYDRDAAGTQIRVNRWELELTLRNMLPRETFELWRQYHDTYRAEMSLTLIQSLLNSVGGGPLSADSARAALPIIAEIFSDMLDIQSSLQFSGGLEQPRRLLRVFEEIRRELAEDLSPQEDAYLEKAIDHYKEMLHAFGQSLPESIPF